MLFAAVVDEGVEEEEDGEAEDEELDVERVLAFHAEIDEGFAEEFGEFFFGGPFAFFGVYGVGDAAFDREADDDLGEETGDGDGADKTDGAVAVAFSESGGGGEDEGEDGESQGDADEDGGSGFVFVVLEFLGVVFIAELGGKGAGAGDGLEAGLGDHGALAALDFEPGESEEDEGTEGGEEVEFSGHDGILLFNRRKQRERRFFLGGGLNRGRGRVPRRY